MRLLVDEDLPRSLAAALRMAGFDCVDARDVGLRGKSDDDVVAYAVTHQLVVITADVGFGNIVRYPLGSHAGIVVARVPHEIEPSRRNAMMVEALHDLSDADVRGNLLVVEPGRIRLRRPAPDA